MDYTTRTKDPHPHPTPSALAPEPRITLDLAAVASAFRLDNPIDLEESRGKFSAPCSLFRIDRPIPGRAGGVAAGFLAAWFGRSGKVAAGFAGFRAVRGRAAWFWAVYLGIVPLASCAGIR